MSGVKVGAVDLFCGIGGLSYGLRRSGIEIVAGIDADASCRYAYEINNDAQFIHENVVNVSGFKIKQMLQNYDVSVLVGCAPCQPFSSHRKDKKNRDKHKDWHLLYQFGRIIEESKPHIVSMENVPTLAKESVFDDFVATLLKEEYEVFHTIVNAADYGVPQRRKRLILLAVKNRLFQNKLSLIGASHQGNYVTVRDTIANLPLIEAGCSSPVDRLHVSSVLSELNLRRIRASKQGGSWQDWPETLVLSCHRAKTGKSYPSVYGRMSWDDVAPTITTQFTRYGTGRFGHPEQDRAISLREGALLQSFPSDYQFVPLGDKIILGNIARHIGNAVPPRLGEIIGKSIMATVGGLKE